MGPGFVDLGWGGGEAEDLQVDARCFLPPDEGKTVKENRDMAGRRRFPMPTRVDPDGHAYMWAHLRGGGGVPRLHYLDHDGEIFVGFLGSHLDNTMTN